MNRRRLRSALATRSLSRRRRRLIAEPLEPRHLLVAFLVTNTNDTGTGSLRKAIADSNTNALADTISFSSLFNTAQTIRIDSQLPTIVEDLSITGPGQDLLTIDAHGGADNIVGNGSGFRIFNIDDGITNNQINVAISGMTLTGGDTAASGGAILNLENLSLNDSTVSGNAAPNGSSHGGGIYSYNGTLDITSSTISGNTARSAGGFGYGGGFTDFTDFANGFLPAFGSEIGVGNNYNEGLDANRDGFVDFTDFATGFLPQFGSERP